MFKKVVNIQEVISPSFISLKDLKTNENIIKYSDEEQRLKMIQSMESVLLDKDFEKLNISNNNNECNTNP
jgi:hypothetical protein